MNMRTRVKKRSRLVLLVAAIFFGIVVFAVAYPMAMGGGALAAY